MFSLIELLGDVPPVSVVDIGAMELAGVREVYASLVESGAAVVTGFEPVKEECDRLRARNRPGHQYLPYAIGDGTTRQFNVCTQPATSSLYEPNTALLALFRDLEPFVRVERKIPITTKRLDDVVELRGLGCHFLKVDVQGAACDVFANATETLRECVAVHTEVEFVELYRGQPLFADVDRILRRNGFVFHKFGGVAGRPFVPFVPGGDPNAPVGQLLWADAVYVRDFTRLELLSRENLARLALILHDVYAAQDLCNLCLATLDRMHGCAFSVPYLDRLTKDA